MNLIQEQVINDLVTEIHQGNRDAGWWTDLFFNHKVKKLMSEFNFDEEKALKVLSCLNITEELDREIPTLLCLIHSEISEAMEGDRKKLMDDKLPHRSMLEVELGDAVIRIFDLAGSRGMDLGGAIREKLEYNKNRLDHKKENRVSENGKAY